MKAEELMQFDWVRLADDNTPKQVDWIRSGEVGLFWNRTVTPPYLEPIPLTAEILEKNGFKKCEDGAWSLFQYKENGENALYQIYWSEDPLYLEISSYTSQTGEFNRMGIRFVHELQHALKLCGIDKTIKL